MKLKSLLVRFWFVLVLFGLSHILTVTEPNDASVCDILIYTNITETPIRQQDSQDTCPTGNGTRAYILIKSNTNSNRGHLHYMSNEANNPRPQLKEVAPDLNQTFQCLINNKCYIIIRGFGVGELDAVAILPLNETSCPSSEDLLQQKQQSDNNDSEGNANDVPVIVQAEYSASVTTPLLLGFPEITFAAFDLPDRFVLAKGMHTVCYSPFLSTQIKIVDDLKNIDFHYKAGVLEIGDSIFSCDFESAATIPEHLIQGDLGDAELPCGFRNFRDRWQADLVWQIGQGETETSATGPHYDATHGTEKQGHYIYMDSPGFALGATASLVSPPVIFPTGGYCVQFMYNMHGLDVSTLRVYLHEVKLKSSYQSVSPNLQQQLGNWGSPRWVAIGNKGKDWHPGGFEFNAEPMQTFQLVFEALAGKSELGDIALDDILIKSGRCPSEVRNHMPKTISHTNQPLVCGEVRLVTGNNAVDKSWYVDGAVSCAGRAYALDQLNQTSWLPCCVKHFGSYKLVLQDSFGDGWTGSYLEFIFFDRLMTFGKDDFQKTGFDKAYTLNIGSLEIIDIQKPSENHISIAVRVARKNSYVWCGVVQAGQNGKPLKIDLTHDVLKKYGVRTSKPTEATNSIVNLDIMNVLKNNVEYDLYCHAEAIGDEAIDDAEQIKQEIGASRIRFSMDYQIPEINEMHVMSTADSVAVDLRVSETSSLWCAAVRIMDDDEDEEPLFGPKGPLEGLKEEKKDIERMSDYFKKNGEQLDVVIEKDNEAGQTQQIILKPLIPNSHYGIYCYAEDTAKPTPNRMTISTVKATKQKIGTGRKIPSVRILRRQTLHKGFRLYVTADAPGQVWCAAAPTDYGVPEASEVARVGASAELRDPSKDVAIEVRGVEANTAYVIYCIGGFTQRDLDETGAFQEYTDVSEMMAHSVSVVSYGKYCEEGEQKPIMTTLSEFTPFHPLTADEEMRARNFVMGRPELALDGVYRLTLLPNKTEIKDYYEGKGKKPLRYARVRAGRCENVVGIYEQLRVGPLDGTGVLSYERIAQPVETDCGGYNPQGVFGRRLLYEDEVVWNESIKEMNAWFFESFGYEYASETCNSEMQWDNKPPSHMHESKCLIIGPIMIEEHCEDISASEPCPSDKRRGRIWAGMKTPTGDQLPIYFIYNLPPESNNKQPESAEEWMKRIIIEKRLPDDFHDVWQIDGLWFEGQTYKSIHEFLESHREGKITQFKPSDIDDRQSKKTELMLEKAREERRRLHDESQLRRLEPQPYPGAAGTAGPIPSRETRRGGLEYRAHPEHVESQGKRFEVQGSTDDEEFIITFAGWNMTITNDRDTAMRVYHISFNGQSVAFEMGLMEALAHYSVSERNWFFLDSWYGGLGAAARKVHKGIECPKTAVSLFWDGSVCVFEQDMARPFRAHWKGGELRDGAPHTTLLLRQMITVSNYDYVTDYRFHLNGIFEASVSFTGELYAGIEVPWFSARQADYGVQVTGAMRFAALHAHMAVWKVDLDVGPADNYKRNTVLLTEVIPDPVRPGANKMKKSFAETEHEAIYARNDSRALVYEIIDEKLRIFGNYGGWRVVPFPGINPLHHDFELYSGPAAWAKYRAFSTVHKYGEIDSTLPRDNKFAKRPATSVDRYVMDNESLRNKDIVVWISDGIFHVPVIEDMPQTIPVGNTLGWMIKPSNLFLEDPSMDLHNAMGGGVEDPGTCAVVRLSIGEVEPTLDNTWARVANSSLILKRNT